MVVPSLPFPSFLLPSLPFPSFPFFLRGRREASMVSFQKGPEYMTHNPWWEADPSNMHLSWERVSSICYNSLPLGFLILSLQNIMYINIKDRASYKGMYQDHSRVGIYWDFETGKSILFIWGQNDNCWNKRWFTQASLRSHCVCLISATLFFIFMWSFIMT